MITSLLLFFGYGCFLALHLAGIYSYPIPGYPELYSHIGLPIMVVLLSVIYCISSEDHPTSLKQYSLFPGAIVLGFISAFGVSYFSTNIKTIGQGIISLPPAGFEAIAIFAAILAILIQYGLYRYSVAKGANYHTKATALTSRLPLAVSILVFSVIINLYQFGGPRYVMTAVECYNFITLTIPKASVISTQIVNWLLIAVFAILLMWAEKTPKSLRSTMGHATLCLVSFVGIELALSLVLFKLPVQALLNTPSILQTNIAMLEMFVLWSVFGLVKFYLQNKTNALSKTIDELGVIERGQVYE